jgi:hypothetical protein
LQSKEIEEIGEWEMQSEEERKMGALLDLLSSSLFRRARF